MDEYSTDRAGQFARELERRAAVIVGREVLLGATGGDPSDRVMAGDGGDDDIALPKVWVHVWGCQTVQVGLAGGMIGFLEMTQPWPQTSHQRCHFDVRTLTSSSTWTVAEVWHLGQ